MLPPPMFSEEEIEALALGSPHLHPPATPNYRRSAAPSARSAYASNGS
jgi:predicted DNA-binding transcriptional regulator YafY